MADLGDDWAVELLPSGTLGQGEEFILHNGGRAQKLGLHDYAGVYKIPGLYEHVVQDLLQCKSPQVATEVTMEAALANGVEPSRLRVLDIGAGNGIVGELLRNEGVAFIVGIDNIPEAREACLRDRPAVYNQYFVADPASIPVVIANDLLSNRFNCLVSVGALGGGHIEKTGLAHAISLLEPGSIVVLTIRSDMVESSSTEGFSGFLATASDESGIELTSRREFIHRKTMSGADIWYVALTFRVAKPSAIDVNQSRRLA